MPRRKSPQSPLMRDAMTRLHLALGSIIIDPTDNGLYETVDETCYLIWEWCVLHGQQPWGWCLDRYCSCKIALAEHEPDPLPGLGRTPRSGSGGFD